jgi:hypothetical protein
MAQARDCDRIKSGDPQQNGRHERMHLKPAAHNFLQQQAKFDNYRLLQQSAAASSRIHHFRSCGVPLDHLISRASRLISKIKSFDWVN